MIDRAAGFLVVVLSAATAWAQPQNQREFFEKKIRPVLAQHCYECHNSLDKKKGGLALDYKKALRAGGHSGKVLVPGKPEESILIWALRHENGYEMPAKAPKLNDAVIKDFQRWVKWGAPDPRLKKPTREDLNQKLPWEDLRKQRMTWWSFQPLRESPLPAVKDKSWAENPIDRFVFARMKRQGLSPQPPASPEVLIRRVHLILTGLPPEPEDVKEFLADPSPEAYRNLVDRLLESKAFGERWARHWMDWYRYAESHGSEGDPRIPYAEEYRDYLIRALNTDVPYDQLLREHLAGDLLENPRINPELEINESAIGPAHLRMVPHGFGATDAYGEQIAFTDNQIDVISKAMLGVTVSCARCHNHKFDPISQKDFYRFYGILVSSRPSNVLIDSPEKLATNKAEIQAIKQEVRRQLADYWLKQVDELPGWLEQNAPPKDDEMKPIEPLGTWALLKNTPEEDYPKKIAEFLAEVKRIKTANAQAIAEAEFYLDLRDPANASKWHTGGNGTASAVSPAGSFAIWPEGESVLRGIYPRGIYTHLISDKHAGVFSSNNYTVRGKATYVRAAGSRAQLRAPVRNYPLIQGLHPADKLDHDRLQWVRTQRKWDYWQGEEIHYELSTDRDKLPKSGNQDRSWFGVSEIYAGDRPPQPEGAPLLALVEDPKSITDRKSLTAAYAGTLRGVVNNWKKGDLTDAEAEFLNAFVQQGFLKNRLDQLPQSLKQQIARYRKREREIPVPRRAPGVLDAEPIDQPLLVRGDPKQEAEPVKRQFLEIFSDRVYGNERSGRLQLAENIVSEANPLKTRVLINRLWAYVFGRGIVASTDNLGRLGKKPTHPELLDFLCLDFERHGWSIKRALRQMVTSRTFRSSSWAPEETRETDPENRYLSHFTPRRLDAEAIYDSIGSIAEKPTRAVYLPVIRNRLHPFLTTFNAPVPTTTVSSRTHTNVPAQSLVMMNGDYVERAARSWSERIHGNENLAEPRDKIAAMFLEAYARRPSKEETRTLLDYRTPDPAREAEIRQSAETLKNRREQLKQAKRQRKELLDPVRKRLQKEVDKRNALKEKQQPKPVDLKPIARWDFDGDARDSIGRMHGELQGKAEIVNGALILNGGFLRTAPTEQPLKAKTLEVLVQLDRLDQSGGGAMTVQTRNGRVFDSIVYAEAKPKTWLAGSNFFKRTIPLDGPAEKAAVNRPVRLAVAYDADGTIRVYRDGKLYAKPYRKAELQTYAERESQVVFGLRHGTKPTGGRMLFGQIHEARLYDRALAKEEIAATANGFLKETVTPEMLRAALSDEQKQERAKVDAKIEMLDQAARELKRQIDDYHSRLRFENGGYFGIAHALLNSKEFLYVH